MPFQVPELPPPSTGATASQNTRRTMGRCGHNQYAGISLDFRGQENYALRLILTHRAAPSRCVGMSKDFDLSIQQDALQAHNRVNNLENGGNNIETGRELSHAAAVSLHGRRRQTTDDILHPTRAST